MGYQVLDLEDVLDIKRKLWSGEYTQAEIASFFYVTTQYISNICRGKAYPNVPWPDGTCYEMSKKKRIELRKRGHKPQVGRALLGERELEQSDELRELEQKMNQYLSEQATKADKELFELLSSKKNKENPADIKFLKEQDKRLANQDAPASLYTWESLLESHKENQLIAQAEGEGYQLRKDAIVEAFTILPQADWESEQAYKLVERKLAALEKSS